MKMYLIAFIEILIKYMKFRASWGSEFSTEIAKTLYTNTFTSTFLNIMNFMFGSYGGGSGTQSSGYPNMTTTGSYGH
jgi:hypothetical protein